MNEKAIDSSADVVLILILPISLLIIFLFATWPVLLAGIVLNISFNFWKRYQWQKWCQKVNPTFHQLIKENRGSITALDLAMKSNFSAAIAKRYLETKAAEFGAQYRDYEQDRVYYFMTASTLGKILDDSELSSLTQQEQIPLSQNQLFPSKDTSATHPEQPATALINHTFEATQTEPAQFQSTTEYQLQSEDSSRLGEVIDLPLSSNQNQLLQSKDTSTHPETAIVTPVQAQTEPVFQSAPAYLLQSELAKRLDVHSSTVYKRRDDPDFPEWSRSKDPEGIAWQFIPDTKQFCPMETKPQ